MSAIRFLLITLAAMLSLTACSSTPYLDQHFGESVTLAKAQQIINLDAAQDTAPVNGIDGMTAAGAMTRYHDAAKEPPAPVNVFNIGLGSGAK